MFTSSAIPKLSAVIFLSKQTEAIRCVSHRKGGFDMKVKLVRIFGFVLMPVLVFRIPPLLPKMLNQQVHDSLHLKSSQVKYDFCHANSCFMSIQKLSCDTL